MALTKFDLALAAIAAAGLVWLEHNHRVAIGPLAAAEARVPTASVCPKTDDAPYSAECIRFIGGGMLQAVRAGTPAQAPYSRPATRSASTALAAPDGY